MEVCRLRRPNSFPPSRSRDVERRAGDLQFSGARGVSCCSPTSFSSAQVSASFTPHASTPVPLPCARQRSKIRSGLPFCHKRSVRALVSLPQEQIEARDDREVKLPTPRRLGASASSTTTISSAVARLSRSARRWRRVGRCEPRVRPSVGMPRLGPLAAQSAARLPLLPPPLWAHTPWLLIEPPSSSQSA